MAVRLLPPGPPALPEPSRAPSEDARARRAGLSRGMKPETCPALGSSPPPPLAPAARHGRCEGSRTAGRPELEGLAEAAWGRVSGRRQPYSPRSPAASTPHAGGAVPAPDPAPRSPLSTCGHSRHDERISVVWGLTDMTTRRRRHARGRRPR